MWPKAGPDLPLRLVVIATVGYHLRKGSKSLYRQPAYLVCTDLDMPLACAGIRFTACNNGQTPVFGYAMG